MTVDSTEWTTIDSMYDSIVPVRNLSCRPCAPTCLESKVACGETAALIILQRCDV